ncbi:MAG: hypothetical protein AAFR24_20800 [Cyanobacteria bacterium J06627_3]
MDAPGAEIKKWLPPLGVPNGVLAILDPLSASAVDAIATLRFPSTNPHIKAWLNETNSVTGRSSARRVQILVFGFYS